MCVIRKITSDLTTSLVHTESSLRWSLIVHVYIFQVSSSNFRFWLCFAASQWGIGRVPRTLGSGVLEDRIWRRMLGLRCCQSHLCFLVLCHVDKVRVIR